MTATRTPAHPRLVVLLIDSSPASLEVVVEGVAQLRTRSWQTRDCRRGYFLLGLVPLQPELGRARIVLFLQILSFLLRFYSSAPQPCKNSKKEAFVRPKICSRVRIAQTTVLLTLIITFLLSNIFYYSQDGIYLWSSANHFTSSINSSIALLI